MKYKIGSFNLCNFSFHSTEDCKKEFDRIAHIIKHERLRIVALQEILSPNALNILLKYLGEKWKYAWMSPNSKQVQTAKGFAYIWNTDYFDLVESNDSIQILNRWSYKHNKSMERPPLYARFIPTGNVKCNFELRLLNVHLVFGDSITKRKEEFLLLAESIYGTVSEKIYGTNTPAYTIVLGDYNLNLKREWNKSPYIEDDVQVFYKGQAETFVTLQDQKTTLKKENDDTDKHDYYANNYDHCSFGEIRFEGVTVNAKKIDALKKYYDNDVEKYKKEISDHVPIVITIDLKGGR